MQAGKFQAFNLSISTTNNNTAASFEDFTDHPLKMILQQSQQYSFVKRLFWIINKLNLRSLAMSISI